MVDTNEQLNQVEWMETDQGSPPKAPKSRPKWLVPIVGFLAIVFIIVVTVLLVRSFVKNRSASSVVEQDMVAAEFNCEEARDIEKCQAAIPLRLAGDTGNADYCNDLEGTNRDDCFILAALNSSDAKLCNDVGEENRAVDCMDAVLSQGLTDESPIESCLDFSEVDKRHDCVANWILQKVVARDCSSPYTEAYCEFGNQVADSLEARDPDLCFEISDTFFRSYCEVMTSPGDRDFDNLNADDESRYGSSDTDADSDDDGLMDGEEVNDFGTDPANPDSDGDGFTDGEEVASGFDPLS